MNLLYDYQYDIVAIIIDIAMLFLIYSRTRYYARSTKIFVGVVLCVLFCSIFDLISIFTVSYPTSVPLWFNYLVCLGYLLFYNLASTAYYMYIDSKGKLPELKSFSIGLFIVTTLFYIVTICFSFKTHLVAYFDDNLNYCHGPIMYVLYVIPFFVFSIEVYIFKKARNRFSTNQIVTSIVLILSVSVSVFAQLLYTRLLIGQVVLSILLFFVYELFENPTYYTYNETRCLNYKAFVHTLHHKIKNDKYAIIIIDLLDYNYIHTNFKIKVEIELLRHLASNLQSIFKNNVFNITTSRYAILCKDDNTLINMYISKLHKLSEKYIETSEAKFKFSFETHIIYNLDNVSEEELVLLTEHSTERITNENVNTVLENIKAYQNKQDRYISIIKHALKNNAIQVYYQPIYNVETQEYNSAEALIRVMDNETGKFVNSEELIQVAEQTGYIDEIGSTVFDIVCNFIKESNIKQYGIKYIEINLSPMQCGSKYLVDTLLSIMNVYGVKAEQINLEITETAEIQDKQKITDNIFRLNREGITLSIDDYGSGFASADYLINFPISIVKIDKSILWSAMKDNNAMVVLKSTISMIKALGKKIVVEGVETQEMADLLKQEGCEFNQGFLFSKPIEAKEFIKFVKLKNLKMENI